jgi:serine/threonine-protein kinase RsbW
VPVPGVRTSVTLRLPRDTAGLQLVRMITDQALAAHGAAAECRQDIAVALAEACGNAIRHARTSDEYTVTVGIADGVCQFEVTDTGPGFVVAGPPTLPAGNAPSGRGLYLIAQFADRFEVDSHPGRGTTVRFAKQLQYTAAPDTGKTHQRLNRPATGSTHQQSWAPGHEMPADAGHVWDRDDASA